MQGDVHWQLCRGRVRSTFNGLSVSTALTVVPMTAQVSDVADEVYCYTGNESVLRCAL